MLDFLEQIIKTVTNHVEKVKSQNMNLIRSFYFLKTLDSRIDFNIREYFSVTHHYLDQCAMLAGEVDPDYRDYEIPIPYNNKALLKEWHNDLFKGDHRESIQYLWVPKYLIYNKNAYYRAAINVLIGDDGILDENKLEYIPPYQSLLYTIYRIRKDNPTLYNHLFHDFSPENLFMGETVLFSRDGKLVYSKTVDDPYHFTPTEHKPYYVVYNSKTTICVFHKKDDGTVEQTLHRKDDVNYLDHETEESVIKQMQEDHKEGVITPSEWYQSILKASKDFENKEKKVEKSDKEFGETLKETEFNIFLSKLFKATSYADIASKARREWRENYEFADSCRTIYRYRALIVEDFFVEKEERDRIENLLRYFISCTHNHPTPLDHLHKELNAENNDLPYDILYHIVELLTQRINLTLKTRLAQKVSFDNFLQDWVELKEYFINKEGIKSTTLRLLNEDFKKHSPFNREVWSLEESKEWIKYLDHTNDPKSAAEVINLVKPIYVCKVPWVLKDFNLVFKPSGSLVMESATPNLHGTLNTLLKEVEKMDLPISQVLLVTGDCVKIEVLRGLLNKESILIRMI